MKLKDFVTQTGGQTGNRFQIDPRLLNVRPNFNLRDLTTQKARERLDVLKAQIKAEGVLEPIEIEFDGERSWINEGHRRHIVVMELIAEGEDIKTVPVVQERQGTNDVKRITHMLMRKKEDYEPLEFAKGVHLLVNVHGKDKADVARELGFKSANSIEQYLHMLAMPSEVQAMVKADQVSATTAVNQVRREGVKAIETLKAAKESAEASGKKRVTPKAVARVTGNGKPKDNGTFLDFVAIGNRIEDEAKRAGGLNKLGQERTAELLRDMTRTLRKAKGQKTEDDIEDDAQGRAIFDEQNPGTASVVDEPPATAERGPSMAEVEQAIDTITNGSTSAQLVGDGGTGAAAPTPCREFAPPPRSYDINQKFFAVICRLATIGEDHDLNALADDHVIEVPAEVIKAADRAYREHIGEV